MSYLGKAQCGEITEGVQMRDESVSLGHAPRLSCELFSGLKTHARELLR